MANLTRFNPFPEMISLRQAMNAALEAAVISPHVKPRQIQIKAGETDTVTVSPSAGSDK
jgi:hypothetical protein